MNNWLKNRRGITTFFLIMFLVIGVRGVGHAAETTENVNVTIPSNLNIVFNEDGTNTASTFSIQNNLLVPIHLESIEVDCQNGWNLTEKGTTIEVDKKEMVLELENHVLASGANEINFTVAEGSTEELAVNIMRGAWTKNYEKQRAFHLNVNYALGKKEFTITFNKKGGTLDISSKTANNGDTVELPIPVKTGYIFKGWEDEAGNLYKDTYIMPIGDAELTAIWEKEKEVFAVYYEEDKSLRFYNRNDKPAEGKTYDGRVVTKVHSNFINKSFETQYHVPWWTYREEINLVEIADDIKAVSTSKWFYYMKNCQSIDIEKLDTSEVKDMSYMFYFAGASAKEFEILGLEEMDTSSAADMSYMFEFSLSVTETLTLDLTSWDTSNVTNMSHMFYWIGGVGVNQNIDLSTWDTSKVTDMSYMFYRGNTDAARQNYYLDFSNWDTSSVTNMEYMFYSFGINTNSVKLIGLSKWNTSKVTSMSHMFYESGKYSMVWEIGDLSRWDTSSVEDMESMFEMAGYENIDYLFDLTGWDVSKVTSYNRFNFAVSKRVLAPAFS